MRYDTPQSETRNSQIVLAPARARRHGGRLVLFAGVAGACAMGVGLGLWARPAPHERQAAQAAAPEAVATPPATTRKLEIVVDERPLATAAPIDVLPGTPAAPAAVPELLAPKRPPQGLIKAQAEIPAPADPAPASKAAPALLPTITAALTVAEAAFARLKSPPARETHAASPERARDSVPEAKARKLAQAEAAHRRAETAKIQLAKVDAAKAKTAKAQAARTAAHKAELVQVEARRDAARAEAQAETRRVALAKAKAEKLQLAQAQVQSKARKAEAAKAHRLELVREAQAEKAETLRLAKAEAKAKAAQHEEARLEALARAAEAKKRVQLVRLARALAHAVVRHDKPAPAPAETAKLDRRHGHKAAHEAKVEQASLKSRKGRDAGRLAAAHAQRARPEPIAPQTGSGLMKVSTTPRCASRDAGEAMVCADPGLSAADRQLARAYQGARAAGVPEAQLQRGQQHWIAARSAAAREAPWAVRDVYMARIAELNGQAKEAQGGY